MSSSPNIICLGDRVRDVSPISHGMGTIVALEQPYKGWAQVRFESWAYKDDVLPIPLTILQRLK